MGILSGLKASFIYGKALKNYTKKNYDDAIELFEEARKIDPKNYNNGAFCTTVGRCYLALEQYEKALSYLERAYELMTKLDLNQYQRKQKFLELTEVYAYVLQETGRSNRAHEIMKEAKSIT